MLINLRNALMAGKKWKNPYITDGLLAMWDGEWNAGGGVHDANATIWKDLVGGQIATLYRGTSVEFTANAFDARNRASLITPIMPDIASAINSGGFTVEVCVTSEFTNLTNTRYLCSYDFTSQVRGGFMIAANPSSASAPSEVSLIQGRFRNGNAWYRSHRDSGMLTIAVTSNQGILVAYLNGEVYATNGTVGTETANQSAFYIADGVNKGVVYQGLFHNIRLSSRALTAAEIAANYAIDKARFGLT